MGRPRGGKAPESVRAYWRKQKREAKERREEREAKENGQNNTEIIR